MNRDQDRVYMSRALSLARRCKGKANPNPTVGCVIVKRGRIVGQGTHHYPSVVHAEIRALQQAGGFASGATVYVTLEPCAHYGRTPPCAPELVRAGVGRVVVAMEDPNPRVSGRGIRTLRRGGLLVEVGLHERRAKQLNESFARFITSRYPLVVGKAAMTLDGRIAASSRRGEWITSKRARAFGQRLRYEMDAILVGIGTVLTDNPRLTYRGRASKSRPLRRVILDGRLRIPADARLFDDPSPIIVFCRTDASSARRRKLEAREVEVVPVARRASALDLQRVMKELGARDVTSVLIEGGSQINGSFLRRRLIDKFYFIVAPILLGGPPTVPVAAGRGFPTVAEAPRFTISRRLFLAPDLVLEAYPEYSRSISSPWNTSGAPPSREPDS